MTKRKWVTPKTKDKTREETIQTLLKTNPYNLSRPLIEFLYNRGIQTLEDIEEVVDNSQDKEHNPLDLKDSFEAATKLQEAINEKKNIVVYGDYDCDGVCATTIAVQCLEYLGARVSYFVNDRFKEGYGMNEKGLNRLLKKYPNVDTILTVDNGISAFEGVRLAKKKGLEVIVTDHHLAPTDGSLPNADVVVNPQRLDDESEFKEICGAAVIYKVMLALYYKLNVDFSHVYNQRDLVGLATIGDVMPLKDENRWFVTEGLRLIETEQRKHFRVLRNLKKFSINEEAFGFFIAPVMNAVGRMEGEPNKAIDFFLEDDEDKLEMMAEELLKINDFRKEKTKEQVELAESILLDTDDKVIVVSHKEFHDGIIGLVAGQLKEKLYKPTIVFSEEDGMLKGSARSIEGFHIKEAFDQISHLIEGYGGHELAAGLSIKKENLNEFITQLNELADKRITEEMLTPKVKVDYVLNPDEINEDLIDEMNRLRPFGQGFQSPLFGLKGFTQKRVQFMGNEKNHVKLYDGDSNLSLIMWRGREHYDALHKRDGDAVQAIGSPSVNVFNGKVYMQFIVHADCLI